MWVGWADVGLWVAVCFLAKISLHRSTCKTTFARLTQSQAISQSFRAFISFRSRRDTTFFSFFETLFYTKYTVSVSVTMVIERSPGGQACRWRAINFGNPPVKFRQERWLHIWRSICTQHVQMEAGLNSDPEMIHFRTKSVTLSMLIDLLIIVHVDRRRWRAHQLTYDLKRCLLFRKCLRFFESENSFGAYVCHRRPGGSMATSHLVYVYKNVSGSGRNGTLAPKCRFWVFDTSTCADSYLIISAKKALKYSTRNLFYDLFCAQRSPVFWLFWE